MKPILLFIGMLVFYCCNLFSQYTFNEFINSPGKPKDRLQIGVKGGIGASNIELENSDKGNFIPEISYCFGAYSEYILTKLLAVRGELVLDKYKASDEYSTWSYPFADIEKTLTTNYMKIPVSIIFSPNALNPTISPYVGGGVHYSYPISARQKLKTEISNYGVINNDDDIKKDLTIPSLGYQGFLGVNILKCNTELRYEYESSKLFKSKSQPDWHFWSAKLILGFSIIQI